MDSLTLLLAARRVGLGVHVKGEKLVVRGGRSQEQLARMLLARKQEVLAALRTELPPQVAHGQHFHEILPYLDPKGVLVIPFASPSKYHWWNQGQDILCTLLELGASEQIIKCYVPWWGRNKG